MSTKSSIFLTNDNEHWYEEHSECSRGGSDIVIELSKANIKVLLNDSEDLIVQVFAGTEIHNKIKQINNASTKRK